MNKPIYRIIITHSHPEQWMGLELFKDVPFMPCGKPGTKSKKIGDCLVQNKRAQFGNLITAGKVIPSHIIRDGTEKFDGLTYEFTKVVDSEISY